MNTNLLFDFTVNKETNTIHVKREFAANLHFVWDAWTKPELLDLWWATRANIISSCASLLYGLKCRIHVVLTMRF